MTSQFDRPLDWKSSVKQDQELQQLLGEANRRLIPILKDSAFQIGIFDGRISAQFCLEIGAAVCLDKPILLVALRGCDIPLNLLKVAKEIIYANRVGDPGVEDQIKAAISRMVSKEKK
jgi:hypothetical protein